MNFSALIRTYYCTLAVVQRTLLCGILTLGKRSHVGAWLLVLKIKLQRFAKVLQCFLHSLALACNLNLRATRRCKTIRLFLEGYFGDNWIELDSRKTGRPF
jgi:hypothetical protein